MRAETIIVLEAGGDRTKGKILSLARFNRLFNGIPRTLRVLFVLLTSMLLLYAMLTLFAVRLLSQIESAKNVLSASPGANVSGLLLEITDAAGKKKDLPPHFPGPQNERQRAVVNSFLHAWNGYKAFAWGKDELDPVNNKSHSWFNMQLTLIESLDTLLIMGLKEEFLQAREEVARGFSADVDKYFSLFEVTIRILGGLLSAFYLSKDELFLQKARMLGDRLLPAFSTRSGLPLAEINPHRRKGRPYPWTSAFSLAELGTLQLEFRSLSRAVGNPAYEEASFAVSVKLHKLGNESAYPGLLPADIHDNNGIGANFDYGTYSVGARADSYYEYLLKQWLQTGKTIDWLKDDFAQAMQAMLEHLALPSKDGKMLFLGEFIHQTFKPTMEHLTCFVAASLALAADNGFGHQLLRDAERVGAACRHITHSDAAEVTSPTYCLLRPEAVEAWFYLYRMTNDTKYQDWGWKMFLAIEQHARTPSGYCSVEDVNQVPPTCKHKMESFLLSETFKYLYLLFDDSHSLLSLKEYVFNTEAHPLPIL
uniref:alpha-1,2-Mannosidase n=1 Tax=Trichuris muris TaxID=70415 RepID=A0A5S6R4E3_TRIMR